MCFSILPPEALVPAVALLGLVTIATISIAFE